MHLSRFVFLIGFQCYPQLSFVHYYLEYFQAFFLHFHQKSLQTLYITKIIRSHTPHNQATSLTLLRFFSEFFFSFCPCYYHLETFS